LKDKVLMKKKHLDRKYYKSLAKDTVEKKMLANCTESLLQIDV